MAKQVDSSRPIEDTKIFDAEQTRLGYRLNKFAMSLVKPENRDAFLQTKRLHSRLPTSQNRKNNSSVTVTGAP